MRCNPDVEFPLILGRDFSGTVINKGQDVTDKEMKIGDKVWGVVPVQDQGCHAEFVKVDSYCVILELSHILSFDILQLIYLIPVIQKTSHTR